MRELRFDGLSPDGTKLVLVGKDGQRWSVTIDERIEAAVRRDRARLSRVEIEREGVLRPREIQARIRAGATAEDVAAASGLPVEHVRRFEGPVLTERAWVAQQAQATEVRRPGGDVELGDLVVERLHEEGVDPADVTWDAWRRDDGLWVVIATFPVGPNTLVATWTYDSASRTMTVADDNARALSSAAGDEPFRLNAHTRPTLTSVGRLQAPVAAADDDESPDADEARDPGDDDDEAPGSAEAPGSPDEGPEEVMVDLTGEQQLEDAVAGIGDDEAVPPAGAEEAAEASADDEPPQAVEVPLFDAPASDHAAPRTGGRPPVPSFDDILFGPGPRK